VTPCRDVVGQQHSDDLAAFIFRVETDAARSSKKTGILSYHYTALRPRKPRH